MNESIKICHWFDINQAKFTLAFHWAMVNFSNQG